MRIGTVAEVPGAEVRKVPRMQDIAAIIVEEPLLHPVLVVEVAGEHSPMEAHHIILAEKVAAVLY